MMLKRKLTIIAFFTLPFVCLSALAVYQKPITLTLDDAIYLALRNNPSLESSELDRITQKYALIAAYNDFEPQYTLTGSLDYNYSRASGFSSYSHTYDIDPSVNLKTAYGTTFKIQNTNLHSRTSYNPSLVFTIMQPLIQGFGKAVVEAALNNAIDNEKIQKLAFKKTAIDTINTIINEYFDLIQSEENLSTDQQTLKDYEQTVKNDRIKIKAGQIAKNDILQDQAKVATQRAAIQQDLNTIQTNKLTLLKDIGLAPETNLQIPKNINFQKIISRLKGNHSLPSLKLLQEISTANNIDYQTAGMTISQLRRSLVTAKDKMNWTLNLTASETRGGGSGGRDNAGLDSLTNGKNHAEALGLDLTIPIDDVGSKQALISARIDLEKAEIDYQNKKRQLDIDVMNDITSVTSNKTQLDLAKQALDLQKQTLDNARKKHNAGIISSFELNSQQETLTTNEQSVTSTEISYLKSLLQLDSELGTTLDLWHIKVRD